MVREPAQILRRGICELYERGATDDARYQRDGFTFRGAFRPRGEREDNASALYSARFSIKCQR